MLTIPKYYKTKDNQEEVIISLSFYEKNQKDERENRLKYFDNLLSNINSSFNLSDIVLWIKSIFKDDLEFVVIKLNSNNIKKSISFNHNKLVSFKQKIIDDNQEVISVEYDNYNINDNQNINTKFNKEYYQNNSEQVNKEIKSILNDFLEMQEIQYIPLNENFYRELILMYNKFYNEVPNLSLAATERKMQNMMFILGQTVYVSDLNFNFNDKEKIVQSQELQNRIDILKSYYVDDIYEYLRNTEETIKAAIPCIGEKIRKHIDSLSENAQVNFLNNLAYNMSLYYQYKNHQISETYNSLIKELRKR